MGLKWGKCDFKELEAFRDKLQELENESEQFCEECAKELAARLLRKVIKRTPVGDYSDTYDLEDDGEKKFLVMSDKQGGTLRRGWTAKTEAEAMAGSEKGNVDDFLDSVAVKKVGKVFQIEIRNPVNYASYVEYGHRQTPGRYVPAIDKKLKEGWVEGKFMLTISVKEIQNIAPALLQKKLYQFLKEAVK